MQRATGEFRKAPPTRAALIRIGVLAAVFAIATITSYKLGWLNYRHTLEHIARLRASHSLPVFSTVFVIASGCGIALGLPGLPFIVAAGALFGTLLGTLVGWTAGLIGATLGYWLARTIGHDIVLRWVRRFRRVDAAVEDARDFDGMLRLRLIPVLPIGVVNFVGGLARTPFGRYMAATAIGILPSAIIYAYFADSLLEGVGNGRRDALKSLVIASILLIALSLVPRAVRWWRGRDARGFEPAEVASRGQPTPSPLRRP